MAGDEPAIVESPEPAILVAEAKVEAPEVVHLGRNEIEREIIRVFGWEADNALCIAFNESGIRADATNYNAWNGTWDVGVFQINDVHGMSWDDRLNPIKNIAKAKWIRDSWGNWNAWTARTKCGL